MSVGAEDVTRERTLAIKGTIRLLADHAERPREELRELAEFAIETLDRVLGSADANGPESGAPD